MQPRIFFVPRYSILLYVRCGSRGVQGTPDTLKVSPSLLRGNSDQVGIGELLPGSSSGLFVFRLTMGHIIIFIVDACRVQLPIVPLWTFDREVRIEEEDVP